MGGTGERVQIPVSYAEKGEDGEGTCYEYDCDGNCIRIHYADGGTECRFYDADGNMTRQVLPESYDAGTDDGEGYGYAYDRAGRLVEIRDPDGNVLHTYVYNGAGQTIKETDGEGQETLYCTHTTAWDSWPGSRQVSAGKGIPPITVSPPIPTTMQAIRSRKPTDSRKRGKTKTHVAGTGSVSPMTGTTT